MYERFQSFEENKIIMESKKRKENPVGCTGGGEVKIVKEI